MKKILIMMMVVALLLAGCQTSDSLESNNVEESVVNNIEVSEVNNDDVTSSTVEVNFDSDMFTERDMIQTYDETDFTKLNLESYSDINIDEEGTYLISGQAEEVTINIDVENEKVQLVLDALTITNEDKPIINIISADKVFITSINENTLTVSDSIVTDEEAVIYSKADLVLNGSGTLDITANHTQGVDSKDDLKITGSVINIESDGHGLEANDSIRVAGGQINITTNEDAFHSENNDDDTLGYIYITGGEINIKAGDDGLRATSIFEMDGGTVNIETCVEGIEATQVVIDGGQIHIYSTDDGINATQKSSLDVMIVVNDGSIYIEMAQGDTDGFDANGDLFINGGTISVDAVSAFDADGLAELNGGTVTVNGEIITEITMQHPGGQGPGRKRP